MVKFFNVIVIGGGHAGTEAAAASARKGVSTALITSNISTIGQMSCNPAIGGLGKGHLVREIDALDGIMAKAIDYSGIHFKVLNQSKGPAVQGPRAQADRALYRNEIQRLLKKNKTLSIIENTVENIIIKNSEVSGIVFKNGESLSCKSIVLTTGTFLGGLIYIGSEKIPAGRLGEKPVLGLSKNLQDLGLKLGRLKTGTPPRIIKDSINWDNLEKQPGDEIPKTFSFLNQKVVQKQIDCAITRTTQKTHEIVQKSIKLSPVYSGSIEGNGPRYCPSIEDKVNRFPERDSHQIFLEPEGLDSNLVYPNGISTALPKNIQKEIISSIPGLENAKIEQYGYAIEYDFVDPRCLLRTLQVNNVEGLFLAGQINGTTGYEEAAGQGLVAGINAAIYSVQENKKFIMLRNQSYIGVMIDDLVTHGAQEPYRMFTSRAEYRLTLRADNADQRLTEMGKYFGIIGKERFSCWSEKRKKLKAARKNLQNLTIRPKEALKEGLKPSRSGKIQTAVDLLSLNEIKVEDIYRIWPKTKKIDFDIISQIKIDAKYSGYLKRQEYDISSFKKDEKIKIPRNINFKTIGGLSNEAIEKFELIKPETLGQAARVSGITPSALISLLRHLRRNAA